MKDRQLYLLLKNDPELKSADFCEAFFTEEEFSRLCEGIKQNTHLEFLYLLDSNINSNHLRPLLEAVSKNKSIHTIKLSKYHDYSVASKTMIETIERHVSLNAERLEADNAQLKKL